MSSNKMTKGEITKKHILETTAFMFWKSSFNKVRIDKIVATAKVNKASFYQYFKNKEEAALESLTYMHKLTKELVFDSSFSNEQHPVKRLEGIFERIYQIHKEQKEKDGKCYGCPFINMANEMSSENEFIRVTTENIFTDFYGYHKSIYQDAKNQNLTKVNLDSELMARQIQGILNGGMISSKVRNCPEDIIDALDTAKIRLGVGV